MNSAVVLRLTGQIDLDDFRFVWEFLLARHSSLRSVFQEEDGLLWQQVQDGPDLLSLTVTRLSSSEGNQEPRLKERLAEETRRPFDLERGPLLRIHLFSLNEKSHVMCVVMHHIVTDGWSTNVMVKDFVAAYSARLNGEEPDLLPLPMRYIDFAVGQREWLEQGEMQRQLDYWRDRLSGFDPLVIPPDRLPHSGRSYPCGVMRTSLSLETTSALRTFSESLMATPFMALLSVVSVVMMERSGQERFFAGTDFANRNHPETESLVGFFVNQLALPIDCATPDSIHDLLMQVKNTVVDAAENQDVPFDYLVDALRVGRRGDGRAPLFQVKVLYNDNAATTIALPGLQIDEYPIDPAEIELDLILMFHADSERIHILMKYDCEIFEAATLECIQEQIKAVLKAMLDQENAGMRDLLAVSVEARRAFETRYMQESNRRLMQRRSGLRPRSKADN